MVFLWCEGPLKQNLQTNMSKVAFDSSTLKKLIKLIGAKCVKVKRWWKEGRSFSLI